MPTSARCWVNTVSLDHVRRAVEGGFTQSDHGSRTGLTRLRSGDGLVFYSPRTAFHDGQPLQQFSAVGVVAADEPYQVEMAADFRPWRVAVDFLDSEPTAARPLVGRLSFVTDPGRWGLPFRRGLFEVPPSDFVTISAAMGVRWPLVTPASAAS